MFKKFLLQNPNFSWMEYIKENHLLARKYNLNTKKKVILFLINKNNSELINKNKKNNIIKQNNRIIKNNNIDTIKKVNKKIENRINYINKLNNIDILFLTFYDWCSTGRRYFEGLKEYNSELQIECLSLFKTPCFEYPLIMNYIYDSQNELSKYVKYSKHKQYKLICETVPYYHIYIYEGTKLYKLLKTIIEKSKIIYLHAESYIELENYDYKNKIIITGVSGHPYRRKPKEYSDFFNKFINSSLIQCPDLLNLGLKNESLVYYGVNTKLINSTFDINQNIKKKNNKLIIGHFSSNPNTKGSNTIIEAINEMVDKYPDKFQYIGYKNNNFEKNVKEKVEHTKTWIDNIKRMYKCDIYIETCKPYLNSYQNFIEYNNTKFGEWGNTCLEAASLGVIVISNTLTKDYYIKEYTNNYPLLIANNKNDILNHLEKISKMSYNEIVQLKKSFYDWVNNNHSLKKTGERFYKKIIYPLLD
jgi:hypothetical protein